MYVDTSRGGCVATIIFQYFLWELKRILNRFDVPSASSFDMNVHTSQALNISDKPISRR